MQGSTKKANKIVLPFLFVLILSLVACGGNSTTAPSTTASQPVKASADKQIFVYPLEGVATLDTLDPALSTDVYSGSVLGMLLDTLVHIDNKGNIVPGLASSWNVSSDNLTWTFHLRPGMKFSDGTSLTSADVAYTLDRSLQPATKSFYASLYLGAIQDSDKLLAGKIKTIINDSVLTPDPQTVIIKTSQQTAPFLYFLTTSVAFVLEKSFMLQYGKDFFNHFGTGGCSGPWTMSKYEPNKGIEFLPNPNYYGKPLQLHKIERPFYVTQDTSYKSYQVDSLDYARVPVNNITSARNLPNKQYHQDPTLSITYFSMNYLVKPFDNIKIDQAFALALNKDAIAQKVFNGTVIPTNHLIPQGMPGYNPDLTGPAGVKNTAGDPALARKLFDEGLQEEGFTRATLPHIVFEVSAGGQAALSNSFAVEQQMWQNTLGIPVEMRETDFNKLVDQLNSSLNNQSLAAWIIGWSGLPDPSNWTSAQFSVVSANNSGNYGQNQSSDAAQQQTTQKLLLQADANFNATERIKQYDQAEQQLINDVAWLPVFQQTNIYVVKPCVIGWTPNPFGGPLIDDWANLYIAAGAQCANTSSYQ